MTIQERMEIARQLLEKPSAIGRFISPIQEGSLQNHCVCGVVTGYEFTLNNLSYRGIWLSTFEDIQITLDGERVPQDQVVLCLKGMKIPPRDLPGHSEVFWGATDVCQILVYQIGGLSQGTHKVEIDLVRRNDFGHTVGNGEEGYAEALEFLNPMKIHDEAEMEVACP